MMGKRHDPLQGNLQPEIHSYYNAHVNNGTPYWYHHSTSNVTAPSPSVASFMNGPVTGSDVFIPMEKIIGGQMRLGFGWNMLMVRDDTHFIFKQQSI